MSASATAPPPVQPAPSGVRHRRQAVAGTAAVVTVLVGLNIARSLMSPWAVVGLSVAAAAGLLLFARHNGLTWAQLGLGRHHLGSGGRWAVAAILAVAAVYAVGLLSPLTRPAFLDSRYHFGVEKALLAAFVVIPVGTVLLEEIAFRSVLWGMLSRHMTTWRVVLVSSSLFGLWHVLPAIGFASASRALDVVSPAGAPSTVLVVLGTVAFTALGGVVAAELRRRSGSVVASVGMHWATNSLGVLFGIVAWRLAG